MAHCVFKAAPAFAEVRVVHCKSSSLELIQIECDTVEETGSAGEYFTGVIVDAVDGYQRWVNEFYVPTVHSLILADLVGAVNQRVALACLA